MPLRHRARTMTGRLSRNQRGSASIEYALIGAAIGLGIIGALISTKRAQNLNLDKISYSMSQAMDKNQLPKTVGSEVQLAPYLDNGKSINQKRVNYTDGSFDLIRTPAEPGYYTISIQNFDKNSREVSGTFIDGAGKTTLSETTYLSDSTRVVKSTGDGSCNCSTRNTTNSYAQPDGSTILVSYSDVIERANATPGTFQQYIGVYSSSPGRFDYLGAVVTNENGTVTRSGQDVSKYIQ